MAPSKVEKAPDGTPVEGEQSMAGVSATQQAAPAPEPLQDPAEVARLRNETFGFVFQQYNLLPALTAAENAAVPLLIAGSLGLDEATTIHLINADLLTCGLATLIQSVGVGKHIGVRLPIIQGVTTTAVSPWIAYAAVRLPPWRSTVSMSPGRR